MNKQTAIDKEKEKQDRDIEALNSLPDDLNLEYVDGNKIRIANNTHDENMKILHRLRQSCGNYQLCTYYECMGSLALQYKFKNLWVSFYSDDAEYALNIVSKGKCRFQEVQRDEKEIQVVCGV